MVFTVTPNRSPTAANAQRAAENWLSRASNEMHAWHNAAQSEHRAMQFARSALPWLAQSFAQASQFATQSASTSMSCLVRPSINGM